MKTPRFFRTLLVRGSFAAAFIAAPAFGISNEELTALRAKAESGNGIAQYNLGLLYASTSEGMADPIEAYVWLNLAADNGATGRALVLLGSQLTPEQISEGKQRLEARRAQLAARRSGAATSPVSAAAAPASPIAPAAAAPSSGGLIMPAGASEVDAEVKKLSSELAAAWKENDQLKTNLAKAGEASTQADRLKRERDELSSNLANANKEVGVLRAALANLEGERNGLREKLLAAERSDKAGLAVELNAANTKLRAAERELAQALALSTELNTAKQNLASLQEQVQALTAENQRLTSAANQATATAERRAAAENELAAARAQLAQVQTQLAEATKRAESAGTAQSLADETQVKLEAALRSYDLQQKELQRVQNALANIDGEREALAKQVAELKSAPKAPAGPSPEVGRLNTELQDVRNRLAASEQALSRLREERQRAVDEAAASAQQQIAQLTRELQDVRQRASAAENAAAKAAQERDAARQQLAAAPAPDANKAEVTALRERLQTTEQALAEARTTAASLAEKVSAAAAPAAAAPAASGEELADIRRQAEETQTKLDAALRTYQLQQEEVDRLQKSLANIDEERARLAERLEAANAQISQVTGQATTNQEAANQLAGVREQLRQAQNQLAAVVNENTALKNRLALSGPPPSSLMSTPTRPGTATAQALTKAPEPAPSTRTHTVASGDTLTRIAQRYYGSSSRWNQILDANRSVIRDPNNLTVGTQLRIP